MKTDLGPFLADLATAHGDKTQAIRLTPDMACGEQNPSRQRATCQTTRTLAAIESALTRLERGVYGLCQACNGPIALRDLDHNPAQTRCRDCKTLDDTAPSKDG